jgi:hypothetical protein
VFRDRFPSDQTLIQLAIWQHIDRARNSLFLQLVSLAVLPVVNGLAEVLCPDKAQFAFILKSPQWASFI